jgi:propionate catabolism operon transcriptional regulator
MARKIGIIATDNEMKETIEHLYPEATQSGRFMVETIDYEQLDHQGQRLEAKGAAVIIGRSGTYDRSVGNVSVPLIRLKVTSLDIFNALVKASAYGESMSLVLWDGINFDKDLIKYIPGKVTIYHFSSGEEIEGLYKQIIETDPRSIIVGGGLVCALARKDKVPSVFVNASLDSIKDAINYAEEVLAHLNNADYQRELLTKTLHSVRDAVILVDENEEVLLFNERAENILKIGMGRVIGKPLHVVLPALSFLAEDLENRREKKEELLKVGPSVISYSTSIIWSEHKVKGMLLTFQDTTRLQMMEQKIRRQLNKKGLVAKYEFSDIIYEDQAMGQVLNKAQKIGKSNSAVVIYGESGTGKEIFAQSLHNGSERKKAPFVAINCAALSETLLESELFGYEEGAFTGARKGGKPGLFELAHGGTIFLDEINSISLTLQGKLLRVIEEKEVMRLGSDYLIPLDVRIISASNEDLKALAKDKVFRSDLFYRLSSLEIMIPPLRERPSDIEPLFIKFIKELKKDEEIRWPSGEELDRLRAYDWPGNVRELRNMAERYIMFDEIELVKQADDAYLDLQNDSIDLKEIQKLVESRIIGQLLKSGLSKNEIADKLGISRATLWHKSKMDV